MKFRTFCIDFDDTITTHTKFPNVGDLRPDADRVIRRIKENGGEICIWTCRTGEHEVLVRDFLKENNIPYDSFNEILPSERLLWGEGGRKVFADCYIDDKGIYAQINGGINWNQIETYIFGTEKCGVCEGVGTISDDDNSIRMCWFCDGVGEV